MDPHSSSLPEIIALLNGTSLIFLLAGFWAVKSERLSLHKLLMAGATTSSFLFLIVYLIHHYQVGSVPYPHHDWTRVLYFFVLIPHIILAALVVPLVFVVLRFAIRSEFEKHKKIARILFPIWVYVSATGLIVYFMLYQNP